MLRVRSVQGNRHRLDGGAMFGNVPRVLWSRWCKPDERGRIELACRAWLVEDGKRRVLLETGVGDFFEPALRERFGVEGDRNRLLDSLAALGLSDEDLDVVVLSHLHFDHAGGLLGAHQEGAPRRLLFPNARYVVSQAAYERASHWHLRDRASFIDELPALLQDSGRLVLIKDARRPADLLDDRYRFSQTEGHTPGMLHTEIVGQAQRMFFCADLAPGIPWVHLPITMGYDRFPERLIDEKARALEAAEENRSWLCFFHDTDTALARARKDARGRFTGIDQRSDLEADLDLDAPE